MANIFALQGSSNSGKSSVLIQLANAIVAKYPTALQTLHKRTKDVKVILSNVNGLIIGIESQGDPNSRLERSLDDFPKANCDIFSVLAVQVV